MDEYSVIIVEIDDSDLIPMVFLIISYHITSFESGIYIFVFQHLYQIIISTLHR